MDVFDCEIVFRAGLYENCGYIWPGEKEPENATVRLAVLNHGDTHNIELLEYTRPTTSDKQPPRPSEPGGAHIAFYVDEISSVFEQIKNRNDVRVLGSLEKEQGGPIDGADWAYLMTSWGLVVELIRWIPGRLPYEQNTSARLVPPPWLRSGTGLAEQK
nr:glyoxalase/bleomycin resistance/dioxygenase family protein [Nocardia vaccinii]